MCVDDLDLADELFRQEPLVEALDLTVARIDRLMDQEVDNHVLHCQHYQQQYQGQEDQNENVVRSQGLN